jgi:hypothetical protein
VSFLFARLQVAKGVERRGSDRPHLDGFVAALHASAVEIGRDGLDEWL